MFLWKLLIFVSATYDTEMVIYIDFDINANKEKKMYDTSCPISRARWVMAGASWTWINFKIGMIVILFI